VRRSGPGGSTGPRRPRRKTASFSRTLVWPLHSASVCGRSFGSTAASSSSAVPDRMVTSSLMDACTVYRRREESSAAGELVERALQVLGEFGGGAGAGDGGRRAPGLGPAVAQIDERGDDVARRHRDGDAPP